MLLDRADSTALTQQVTLDSSNQESPKGHRSPSPSRSTRAENAYSILAPQGNTVSKACRCFQGSEDLTKAQCCILTFASPSPFLTFLALVKNHPAESPPGARLGLLTSMSREMNTDATAVTALRQGGQGTEGWAGDSGNPAPARCGLHGHFRRGVQHHRSGQWSVTRLLEEFQSGKQEEIN